MAVKSTCSDVYQAVTSGKMPGNAKEKFLLKKITPKTYFVPPKNMKFYQTNTKQLEVVIIFVATLEDGVRF